ncbi:MAG TPA: C1 family peptidase [Candidatus Saccharimonadales bacterium]|jgi:C1A family cysteine protease
MAQNVTAKNHGLGWLPDLPDQRDVIFDGKAALAKVAAPVPKQVDLRAKCPPVYNQGALGSCTANALAAAFDFDRHAEGDPFMTPSRLFIYWNERELEGTTGSDAGARIRDGVKVLKKIGTPPETDWPYDIAEFTDKPNAKSFADARKNEALTYQRIVTPLGQPTHDMLACLASGYPFVSGITLYESFESPTATKTGVIPMPGKSESVLGGHAIVVVGFEQAKQRFICRNSWGKTWGDKGYFYLPFAYLTSRGLASDMWVIKTVEV